MKFTVCITCSEQQHRVTICDGRVVLNDHLSDDARRDLILNEFNSTVNRCNCLVKMDYVRSGNHQRYKSPFFILYQSTPLYSKNPAVADVRQRLALDLGNKGRARLVRKFWKHNGKKFNALQADLAGLTSVVQRFLRKTGEVVKEVSQKQPVTAEKYAMSMRAANSIFPSAGWLAGMFYRYLVSFFGAYSVTCTNNAPGKWQVSLIKMHSDRAEVVTLLIETAEGYTEQFAAMPWWWQKDTIMWTVNLVRWQVKSRSALFYHNYVSGFRTHSLNPCSEITLDDLKAPNHTLSSEFIYRPPDGKTQTDPVDEDSVPLQVSLSPGDSVGDIVFCLSSLLRMAVGFYLENCLQVDPVNALFRKCQAVRAYIAKRLSEVKALAYMTVSPLLLDVQSSAPYFYLQISHRLSDYSYQSRIANEYYNIYRPEFLYGTDGFPLARELLNSIYRQDKLREHKEKAKQRHADT